MFCYSFGAVRALIIVTGVLKNCDFLFNLLCLNRLSTFQNCIRGYVLLQFLGSYVSPWAPYASPWTPHGAEDF